MVCHKPSRVRLPAWRLSHRDRGRQSCVLSTSLMLPLNFGSEVFQKNRSHPQTAILLHRIAVDSFLHDDPLAHHVLTRRHARHHAAAYLRPGCQASLGLDEVRGHARPHGAKPKNRNFAHVTPRLARDSCGLLARPRGVSGFTIRRPPCRNGRHWPGNGRRRPTDRGRSCCPGQGVPPTVRAQRHNPAGGACCRP
jgi:hypothetical protein